MDLPSRLAILPFRNKVLLPGAIIRIRCTSPSSVKLVEQELWQREEKGLIGILPVRDSAEIATSGTAVSSGVGGESAERGLKIRLVYQKITSLIQKINRKLYTGMIGELQPVLYISREELRNQVAELHT